MITQDGTLFDGERSYALAIAALREIHVRAGKVQPLPERPDELRWAAEGPRPVADLDTVRGEP